MTTRHQRRARRTTAAAALLTVALAPGLTQLPALAADDASPTSVAGRDALNDTIGTIADPVAGLTDLDLRGSVLPSAAQKRAARALDAGLGGVSLRWNDYGTPSSVLAQDGVLAPATSANPVRAARTWLQQNAALFGLTATQMGALQLVNDQELASYPDADGAPTADAGHAVLFRQRFGGLPAASGSMVTVGVADGSIVYASSSLARTAASPRAAALTPLQAWAEAAANVGRTVSAGDLSSVVSAVDGGRLSWTRLTVPGFAQEQQVRLRSLALADGRVRPVYVVNVVDVAGGASLAYTLHVDAVTGKVWTRQNQVENDQVSDVFSGTFTATECGPKHAFELTDDNTRSINAVGLALPVDDITVKFFGPGDELLYTGDLLTSPEVATFASDDLPAGVYSAQVCPYDDASAVIGTYSMIVATSDTAAPSVGDLGFDPSWAYWTANPDMASTEVGVTPENEVVGCWVATELCNTPTGPFENLASPIGWDTLNAGAASSLTTIGNNANTHEAWVSPLTPGGLLQAPVSPTRDYTPEFTDAWNESQCDPTNLVPGGNDIEASVANLFVSHNRMHDYSYYLGFTEKNYNMQLDNFGRGGVGGDQEVGNAQAGALTGGQPLLLGRDNANQIALQDGIPGITNQYLFQPIAGSFYAPCTDGGLDMGIVGHEYTHAISNRMVAGPDEGLTSEQGGAMGESWSDLVAAEYQFSHGYDNGGNVWAVGVYATGNTEVAIRDYAINENPLNYSNYGFDTTGAEVHADGEIWNGAQWEVRQALVEKYDARFPYDDADLQLQCAQGGPTASPLAPQYCPGNRRWVQLMFDSFLLQQGSTSMLDARDAMLAADKMRFGGADVGTMWHAFARRGMGPSAVTDGGDDTSVVGGFSAPRGNGKVAFKAGKAAGKVYVGVYEARSTPFADTYAKTKRPATRWMAPGTYTMVFVSPAGGFKRMNVTVRRGRTTTVQLPSRRNLAAAANGASVIGATEGSLKPEALIDGTEDTNWAGVTAENVDVTTPSVSVDLAGGTHTVKRVQVSALLNPVDGEDDIDQDSGSRFTALRQFAIEVCTDDCAGAGTWTRVLTSSPDAFPGVRPRPVAPDQTLRAFVLDEPVQASAVRLVALENQCTGYEGYAGEIDNDPLNDTDCATASTRGTIVHAAELQVFAR
ncbi:M36 family metallopeptidase [Nocardioides bruguierae]|uniref:M36 family metallopeptidase n=1 Tax=Nocardioides bruguierae TaxID=2945102 RepID=A0A9X2DAN8_9ACTN|nr:M36 family metallopeptidase [Nocardioides bruguierae]MCM0621902.1 M36 family metallopeptidase [Nocardioides bruguierae]